LVDKTGSTEKERIEAIENAYKKIDSVIDEIWR